MLDVMRNSSQTWWVRSIFIILILVFVSWGVGAALFAPGIDLALVNGEPITQEQFLRKLEQEKQEILSQNPSVTMAVLEQLGIRQKVFTDLALQRLLTEEAKNIGLFVTDKLVQDTIVSLPLFKNKEGVFDKALYMKTLENNREGVLLFEDDLRRDLLIQKLMMLVGNSAYVSTLGARDMYDFINEERAIEYSLFPAEQYVSRVKITEDEVKDFYDKNKTMWDIPEQISLEYIPFTAENALSTVIVSKEEVEAYYTQHKVSYEKVSKEEATKTIEKILKQQKALYSIEDLLDKAQALLIEGKSLSAIATSLGLRKEKIEALPFQEAEIKMHLQADSINKLRSAPLHKVFIEPLPLRKKGEFALVAVSEITKSGPAPFASVEADVERTLINKKAMELAKKFATLAIKDIDAGRGTRRFVKTDLFTRLTTPINLPVRSPEFIKQIFSAQTGVIFPEVFSTTEGVLIAKVYEVKPVTKELWEKNQASFSTQIKQMRAQQIVQEFQTRLYKNAKIEVLLPELLAPQNKE